MTETNVTAGESADWRTSVRDSLFQHPRDHLALWSTLLILLAASVAAYRRRSGRAGKTPSQGVGDDDAAQYESDGPLENFCVRHAALQRDNALRKTPIQLDTSYVRALALHVPYYYVAYFRDVDFGPVLAAIAVGEYLVNDNPWSVVPLLAFAALHAARQTFAVSNVLYDQTRRNNRVLERARYDPTVGAYRVARVRRRELERGDLVLVSRTSSPTLPADLLLLRGRLFTDESQAFGEDAIQHRDGILPVVATAASSSAAVAAASSRFPVGASECGDDDGDLASWLTADFRETLRTCRLTIRHRSASGSISTVATATRKMDGVDREVSTLTVTRRLQGAGATAAKLGDEKRETPAAATTTATRYDVQNVAFADTLVRDGAALGVVIETGGDAHVHRAAPNGGRRDNTMTLAKRRLDRISTVTFAALVVLSACSALVTHHQARHPHSFAALVMLMALLFNSMIPLSLPFVLDCAGAVLAERLAAKHDGRVRFNRHGQNAHQARPTEIVSDKTGTLTTNRVTLTHVLGVRRELAATAAAADGDKEKTARDADRIECRSARELAAECASLTTAVMACTGLLVAPALGVVRSDVLDAELLRRLPYTLVHNGRLSGDAVECGSGAESSASNDTVWALRDLKGDGAESRDVENADRDDSSSSGSGSGSGSNDAEIKDGKKAPGVGRLTRVRYRMFTHALGCKLAVTRARLGDNGKYAYTLHVQGSPSALLRYMSDDGSRRQLEDMMMVAEQLPVAAGTYRKILAYASRALGDSFSNTTSDSELLAELRDPMVYVFADGIVAGIRESIRQLLESSPEMRFTMLSGDSRASCLETGAAVGVVNTMTSTATTTTTAAENGVVEKKTATAVAAATVAAAAGPGKLIEVRELDDAAARVAEIESERVDVGVAARTLVLNGELLAALTQGTDTQKNQLRTLLAATRTRVVYRAPPQGKQQLVAFVNRHLLVETLMAGDGANDVAAIERADVGVAIRGGESSLAAEAAHVVVDSWREIPAFVARCREPQLVVQVAAQWTVMRSMMTSFTNLTRLLLSNFVTLKSRGAGNVGHLMPLVNTSVFSIVMSYVYDESLLQAPVATVAAAATAAAATTTSVPSTDAVPVPGDAAKDDSGGSGSSVRVDTAALSREVAEAERREQRLSFVRVLAKGAVISVVDACLVLPARRNDLRTLVSIHILQLLLQLYAFKRTGWTRRSLLLHAAIVVTWGIWHAFVCGIRAGDLWSLVATWLIFLS